MTRIASLFKLSLWQHWLEAETNMRDPDATQGSLLEARMHKHVLQGQLGVSFCASLLLVLKENQKENRSQWPTFFFLLFFLVGGGSPKKNRSRMKNRHVGAQAQSILVTESVAWPCKSKAFRGDYGFLLRKQKKTKKDTTMTSEGRTKTTQPNRVQFTSWRSGFVSQVFFHYMP